MVVLLIVDKAKEHKVPKKHWIWFIPLIVSNATGVDIGYDCNVSLNFKISWADAFNPMSIRLKI